MPQSAIEAGAVDYVLPLRSIAPALVDIVHGRPVSGTTAAPS
jgi:chemotaxis response regulator CheB